MSEFTRKSLVKRANEIWVNMLDAVAKAGVKREWNRFTGSQPSKNDIVRAAIADLRILNEVAEAHGWDAVYTEAEEATPKLGKITK